MKGVLGFVENDENSSFDENTSGGTISVSDTEDKKTNF
jgi:hypothetical protein